jgi:SP family facilitated glucose transporter-like MFS transporter 8
MDQESWLGSLSFLGALLSSLVYSFINHILGCKAAGYLSAAPLIVGWLLVIFANSVTCLFIAKIVMELGMSGINIFLTMYVGQIAEDNIRGTVGNIRGLAADGGRPILFGQQYGSYMHLHALAVSLSILLASTITDVLTG